MSWYTYKIKSTGFGFSVNPPMTSVEEIDQSPAVAFSINGKLYFSIYNFSSETWTEKHILDGVAEKCEIKLVESNGNPGIFYYNQDSQSFNFVRSDDSRGNSWTYDVVVGNSSINSSSDFSIGLTYDSSNMLVSFIGDDGFLSGYNYCVYSLSHDINGFSWGLVKKVDGTQNSSSNKVIRTNNVNCLVGENGRDILFLSDFLTGTIVSSLSDPKIVLMDDSSGFVDIYYSGSSSLFRKRSSDGSGSSWPSSSATLISSFDKSVGSKFISGIIEEDNSASFVYRNGSLGINYYKGYNINIVSTSDYVGNFDLSQTSGSNILVSYYQFNSGLSEYEVKIASQKDLSIPESNTSSSSSIEDNKYVQGYFNSGINLLNVSGNMAGQPFELSEQVNICSISAYSGDSLHTIKLEDIDRSAILCEIPHYSEEVVFDTIPAGTRLRIIVDDGSPGDIINSFEIKFRFQTYGESSSLSESFTNYSSQSSLSSQSSESSSLVGDSSFLFDQSSESSSSVGGFEEWGGYIYQYPTDHASTSFANRPWVTDYPNYIWTSDTTNGFQTGDIIEYRIDIETSDPAWGGINLKAFGDSSGSVTLFSDTSSKSGSFSVYGSSKYDGSGGASTGTNSYVYCEIGGIDSSYTTCISGLFRHIKASTGNPIQMWRIPDGSCGFDYSSSSGSVEYPTGDPPYVDITMSWPGAETYKSFLGQTFTNGQTKSIGYKTYNLNAGSSYTSNWGATIAHIKIYSERWSGVPFGGGGGDFLNMYVKKKVSVLTGSFSTTMTMNYLMMTFNYLNKYVNWMPTLFSGTGISSGSPAVASATVNGKRIGDNMFGSVTLSDGTTVSWARGSGW